MSFCFIHAADLHLDTPYEGVGEASPQVADALREASLAAFDDLVRLTLERKAAFLLLAGDIYDGAERGVRAQLRFLAGLRRLSQAGIRVFVVHGNHDPVGGWPGVREWPEGVRVFGADVQEESVVEREGVVLARVQGISYGRREVSENLAVRLRPSEGPGLKVALLHANVGGDATHAPYSPCSLDHLLSAGFDYWALGHIHRGQVLHEGRPWVVYPGSTQGRSLKPSERGPKGACVVHVQDGTVRGVDVVSVDQVRFAVLEVDVSGLADLGGLRGRLQREAEGLRAAAEGRALVVRTVVRGRGPVHADLRCAGSVDDVVRDLRDEYEGEHPFLWWESVRDETRPAIDLEAIRARDDFSAALVSQVDGYLERDGEAACFLAERVLGSAPRKVAVHAASLEAVEAASVVEEARALALDLLEEEAGACT